LSRLDNLVAVVTGGAGDGIGKGISAALAKAGAQVIILDIDKPAAARVVEHLMAEGARRPSAIETDVSSEQQVQSAFSRIAVEYGRIDILVNNAGVGLIRQTHETTLDEFSRLVAVDFQGVWLCCKYAIPAMQKQKKGSIVNIGSVHGTATLPDYSLYAGAKAGLAGFTRGLAVQYGVDGIRANIISPGLVDGSQTRSVLGRLGLNAQTWIHEFVEKHQALTAAVTALDIGHAVVFLASDDARAITGVELPVDAGTLAQLTSRN
jgi:NAD(P)-dependent dehydrogenase (short-subunit alcohol dehydrogenase family)